VQTGLKIAAGLSPLAVVGAAAAFAPTFTWQLAYNMKTPMTVFAVIVGLLSAIVIHDQRRIMSKLERYSTEYAESEYRIWTAVNFAAVTALIWLFIQAIPDLEYMKKVEYRDRLVDHTVTKEVPVTVYGGTRVIQTPNTYIQAFEHCRSAMTNNDGRLILSSDDTKLCHIQALEVMDPHKVVVVTKTRTVTQVVHDKSDYAELYQACMSKFHWNSASIDTTNSLIDACRKVARQE
jgi:hypothetical protein